MQTAPPLLFSGLRILAAGVVLLAVVLALGQRWPSRRDWLRMAVPGVALEGVANGVAGWAALQLPSGVLALMMAMVPLWIVGLSALSAEREALTRIKALGLGVSLAGLLLLLSPSLMTVQIGGLAIWPILAMQGVCLSWAAGTLFARKRPAAVTAPMAAAGQMVAAGGALTLAGTVTGEWSRFHPDAQAWSAMAYLMVFGSLIGYGCFVYALPRLPVATFSLYVYVNPVVALFLGWLILGERLGIPELAGAGLVLAGVALAQRGEAKSSPAASHNCNRP